MELEPAVHIYMMQQRESCQQKMEQKNKFCSIILMVDSSEETLEDLNGFDKNNKYELQELFWLFRDGYIGKNVQKDDSGKYEITAEIEDTVTSNFYINGTKVFTAYRPVTYTDKEIKMFSDLHQHTGRIHRKHMIQPITVSILR